MLDNSLKFYDMDKQLKNLPKKKVDDHLDLISNEIDKELMKSGKGSRILTHLSAIGFKRYRNEIGDCDKLFNVESHCNQCGVCIKVCPENNIKLGSSITFNNNCIRCYACTQNCPSNAIRYDKEKSKTRFRNAEVTLKEIINANI